MGSFFRRNAVSIFATVLIVPVAHAVQILDGVTPKLHPLACAFSQLEAGYPFPLGTMLSISGLMIGGPIYFWLHYPIALLGLPFYGLHVMYAGLDLAALLLWFWLGRRHFEERHVLWTGVFMAFCSWTKVELGESSLFLIMLPWLLLLLLLRAAERERAFAYVAPALVWGLCLQLHLSALFIAPAVLLFVWRAGGRPTARLLVLAGIFFAAGIIPTFGPVLLQLEQLYEFGQLTDAVTTERSGWVVLGSMMDLLLYTAPAIIGLLLALRQRPAPPWRELLALWLVIPALVVLMLDPDDFKTWHYVIIMPPLAILSGLSFQRLEQVASKRRFVSRLCSVNVWAVGALMFIILVDGLKPLEAWEPAKTEGSRTACRILRQSQSPGVFAGILSAARQLRSGNRGRPVRFTGLAHDHLSGAMWIEDRGSVLAFDSEEPRGGPEVFAGFPSPALDSVGTEKVLFQDGQLRVVTPAAVLRLKISDDRRKARSGAFPLPRVGSRFAVVHLEGDLGFVSPELRLVSGKGSTTPIYQSVCSEWGMFLGQYTFDLHQLGPSPGPVRLEVTHSGGVINYLAELVLLPGAG